MTERTIVYKLTVLIEQKFKYKLSSSGLVAHGTWETCKGCTFKFATEEEIDNYPSIEDLSDEFKSWILAYNGNFKNKTRS